MNLDVVTITQTKSTSKKKFSLETIPGCLFHAEHKNSQEKNKIFFFTWREVEEYNKFLWRLPKIAIKTLRAVGNAYDYDFQYTKEFDGTVVIV